MPATVFQVIFMRGKLTQSAILKKLETNRTRLNSYGVRRIGLFGSYARGAQRMSSDIDFLVKFSNVSFDNYMDLKFFLERLFKKKVDLVTEESLKPELKYVKQVARYAKAI